MLVLVSGSKRAFCCRSSCRRLPNIFCRDALCGGGCGNVSSIYLFHFEQAATQSFVLSSYFTARFPLSGFPQCPYQESDLGVSPYLHLLPRSSFSCSRFFHVGFVLSPISHLATTQLLLPHFFLVSRFLYPLLLLCSPFPFGFASWIYIFLATQLIVIIILCLRPYRYFLLHFALFFIRDTYISSYAVSFPFVRVQCHILLVPVPECVRVQTSDTRSRNTPISS